jgi:hypothetical protein
MPTWSWIVIVVAVIVIVAVIVTRVAHQRRTAALRDRFGEEYERTVEHAGGIRAAEHELLERERLHDGLELHPLSEVTRSRYLARWSEIQATFVDEPKEAVEEADGLVQRVMHERGYPDDVGLDESIAVVSVDHPDTVQRYREAHGIALRARVDDASTEDLRQAMTHYRALFDELLTSSSASGVR